MKRCDMCGRRIISGLERRRRFFPFWIWPNWLAGRMNCGGACWRCINDTEQWLGEPDEAERVQAREAHAAGVPKSEDHA